MLRLVIQHLRAVLGREEEGQALTEYGLILALIAVMAIAALAAIGLAVRGNLDEIASFLNPGGS